MISDIIIIGGGASGLVAAITAARDGKKVTILEHKDRIGKKILATGNGKCNYTNEVQTKECYRGEDSSFAWKVLSYFGVEDTVEFFKELGILPKVKNGYYYPNSEQASSILDVLRYEIDYLKVNVVCEAHVDSIKKKGNLFIVGTSNGKYQAEKVILATGGCASSDLGSDGSGYSLAKLFGHTIIEPVPALVQLRSNGSYFKTLSGVRVETRIDLYVEDKLTGSEKGELQLTNYGVSGIPIFQLSRYASRAIKNGKRVYLIVDFMPGLSKEEMFLHLQKRFELGSYKTMEESFIGLLNKKLAYVIMKESKLDPNQSVNSINKNIINRLVQTIKSFKIEITEPNPLTNAQVSAGGVATREIDPDTLESKKSENLYIIGELLDIDGTCGGYNLQWAWATGYLAGKAAAKGRK